IAEGYSADTIVNNMILQLLIVSGYLTIEEITRGRINEKVNRETLAAAKSAAIRKMKEIASSNSGNTNTKKGKKS
ncbi:MAG: hypothetical protein ACM3MI_08745, partial [Clostridiales bacterium]